MQPLLHLRNSSPVEPRETEKYAVFINGGCAERPGFEHMKARLGRPAEPCSTLIFVLYWSVLAVKTTRYFYLLKNSWVKGSLSLYRGQLWPTRIFSTRRLAERCQHTVAFRCVRRRIRETKTRGNFTIYLVIFGKVHVTATLLNL